MSRVLSALVLGFVAFLGFAQATTSQVAYGDVAEFQTLALTGGLAHSNGYSVYITLANLFARLPLGPAAEAAYRTNLLSAVFGGITVALLALFVARESRSVLAGLFAGASFAFLETTWALSTVASPYTLDTATTLTVVLLLASWSSGGSERLLYLGLFIWGISFGGHSGTVLLAPGVAVIALPVLLDLIRTKGGREQAARLGRAVLAFFAGLAVYVAAWLYQDSLNVPHDFLRTVGWIAPDTWVSSMDTILKRFLFQATNQEWRPAVLALPGSKIASNVVEYVSGVPTLFTRMGVLLIAVGSLGLLVRRPRLGIALLLIFAAQLAFWLTDSIYDLQKHLLPNYLLLAAGLGFGVGETLSLADLMNTRWRPILPGSRGTGIGKRVVLCALAAVLAWLVLLPTSRTPVLMALGQRPVNYQVLQWLVPPNRDEPRAQARLLLDQLPPQAVVFGDFRKNFTLAYVAEFQLGRHDLLFTRMDHYSRRIAVRRYASRPMYFVESPVAWVPQEFKSRVTRAGPLYALAPPR